MSNYPKKYIPSILSYLDKNIQKKEINKSRKAYKLNKYYSRKKVKSFKSKPSGHVEKAKKIYKIVKITPSRNLAKKTGFKIQRIDYFGLDIKDYFQMIESKINGIKFNKIFNEFSNLTQSILDENSASNSMRIILKKIFFQNHLR